MVKKRWLIALFMLWILAAGQMVQGHVQGEKKVTEVFARVGGQEQTGVVEYYGVYEKGYLQDSEREAFLEKIAGELGITDSMEITRRDGENRQEVRLLKNGSNARTELRFLTSNAEGVTRQYMIIKIMMKGDIEHTYAYRVKLDKILAPYAEVSRSSANIIGTYEGKLSLEERNELADSLLAEMDARIVSENREMQLYTIYGYTPWISDRERQGDEEFNVNIAIHYNTNEDKTYVYVAVPAVGLDY